MEIVTLKEMENDKVNFFHKHTCSYNTYDTGMMNNCYKKEFFFDDGSAWYEVNEIVEEEVEVERFGTKLTAKIKYFRCEYWSTENSKSKYYIERV